MRRLAFLFRPSWLALAVVVLAFAYLCFTVLAPWQLGKNTTTSRANSQLEHALTAQPVPVTELLPQQDSSAPDEQWRPVTATGRYLPEAQVLVRLRVIDGVPAYEVLTPFAVHGGPTVLVNRGFVRTDDGGTRVPEIPAPPTSEVTVTARLRDSQAAIPGKNPFTENGFRQVYSINTDQIAELTKVPLTGSYLQLADDQPGGLGVIALPRRDAGPFLSYGIQWIAFGILAPIGLGYFAFAELRARRAEKALGNQADGDGQETGATEDAQPAPPMTVEQKLADRYGRRR
ncbi:SURF1 family cytochrome oxidase biogenesis protein [[Mycobacterium] nativiensis]|uniref:SURF1-like protein n=1 Tax=[Mycobacterium] nativiensis TaxID=2855503 RepID=A0ABU5Y2S9_9MYCO|nr:SURF1 family protein [Mycolicibacter sp. MYC340]MEB3034516.1 SURF1 family protein [Mycolicibacter sp. MYC340]